MLFGLLDNKECSLCGEQLPAIRQQKLMNGYCCPKCKKSVASILNVSSNDTVESIKFRIEFRDASKQKLQTFQPTRTFGTKSKILIDEINYQFIYLEKAKQKIKDVDVYSFSQIGNVSSNITHTREEIVYRDSNGTIKSFCLRHMHMHMISKSQYLFQYHT